MTAWRTAPVCQADTTKGNNDNNHGAISQPVTAAPIPKQPSAVRSSCGFAASIKQLFREVKQALTASIDGAPKPKKRNRGSGEAQSGFRLAAITAFRRVVGILSPHGFSAHWEPFTWLRLWEYDEPADTSLHQDRACSAPTSDLSPGP